MKSTVTVPSASLSLKKVLLLQCFTTYVHSSHLCQFQQFGQEADLNGPSLIPDDGQEGGRK